MTQGHRRKEKVQVRLAGKSVWMEELERKPRCRQISLEVATKGVWALE